MVKSNPKRSAFLFRNLLRGLIWLGSIIGIFILFKKYISPNYIEWLAPVYNKPAIIYTIFLFSEIIFGLIPPEIFMIWALKNNQIYDYFLIVGILAVVSYLAGLIGYFIGKYLNTTLMYRFFRRKFLTKSEKLLNLYGPYLIIVAALTPLPFSGVSMLIGSVRFSLKKYLLFSSTRILRFAAYSWIIWEVNMI